MKITESRWKRSRDRSDSSLLATAYASWLRIGRVCRGLVLGPRQMRQHYARRVLRRFWVTVLPFLPQPVRLPHRILWLAWNDSVSDEVSIFAFEREETKLLEHVIGPGMTVVDVGAHAGFYTVLASKLVGECGSVLAFEPSPRERKRLRANIKLNRCRNARVEPCALGAKTGRGILTVVRGRDTGCNSLRPPAVDEFTERIEVSITTLDQYFDDAALSTIDFLKLDVEGGELDVLKGAVRLLSTAPRPIVLCEVEDRRTNPWGYEALEIVRFLEGIGYRWYTPTGECRADIDEVPLSGNLLAVPQEKVESFARDSAKPVKH